MSEEPKLLIDTVFPVGREMVLVRRVWIAHKDAKEDATLKGRRGVLVRVLGVVDLDKDGFLPEPAP